MPRPRLQDILIKFSFGQKLLLAGSLLMTISLFLPWYQDIDQFKTGDVFLGISGPVYLIGCTLLLFVIGNISLLFMETSHKELPIPLKPSQFYLASGLISFYFLILINSIYFHQKFGVNISVKQSDFGMFFAFIAASLMTIGGYLCTRDKVALLKEFQKETQTSPFTMPHNDVRRPKENLRTIPQQKPVYQKTVNIPVQETPKPVSMRLERSDSLIKEPVSIRLERHEMAGKEPAVPSTKAPQPFRTDL